MEGGHEHTQAHKENDQSQEDFASHDAGWGPLGGVGHPSNLRANTMLCKPRARAVAVAQ
jgi:hypothetical protein